MMDTEKKPKLTKSGAIDRRTLKADERKLKQLSVALAARKEKLAGRSPRMAGHEKKMVALNWIYRWGWASPQTINLLGGSSRTLATRLVKTGFLCQTRTESGGGERGVPIYVLTLTQLGLEAVEGLIEDDSDFMPYELNPWKSFSARNLRHDQLAQMATARNIQTGVIKIFQTPKQLAEKSIAGQKQPDVVWVMPNNVSSSVEVELTQKYNRHLDAFILGTLQSIYGKNKRFDSVVVVGPKGVIKRYQQFFKPGATFHKWKKNDKGYWVHEGPAVEIKNEWVEGKMTWTVLSV